MQNRAPHHDGLPDTIVHDEVVPARAPWIHHIKKGFAATGGGSEVPYEDLVAVDVVRLAQEAVYGLRAAPKRKK
ncbi:hypothetical protein KC220_27295, partial [Mycobacterium tuberculosis]|nr:hypothetical protein [Mycobacterium tuberculosis]